MMHTFCAPFDADMVITRMMSGSTWPRAGYLKSDVSFTRMSRLRILCPEILGLYSGSPRDDERISKLLRDLSSNQDIADELEQLLLFRSEINRGQKAAHYGTYMHYLFEAILMVIRWRLGNACDIGKTILECLVLGNLALHSEPATSQEDAGEPNALIALHPGRGHARPVPAKDAAKFLCPVSPPPPFVVSLVHVGPP